MPARPTGSSGLNLLLLCARMHIDEACAARIEESLRHDIDWETLLPKARRHGLIPLMHRNLSALDTQAVPAAFMQKLKTLAENYRFHNLMLVAELLSALRAFEAAGIQVLPYKGPALAAYLYGDMGLRHITDLDLLVHPRDAVRARRVLLEQGHVSVPARSERMAAMLLPFHYEYAFTSKLGTIIELTWRMGAAYWRLPQVPAAAWDRLGSFSFGGTIVPWLAPEDLLLILCLHGCKHKWDTLKWLVDIAELLRGHPQLDWRRLMSDARETGAERMLGLSLLLAHDVLDAPLPAEVLDTIRRMPSVAALEQEVCDQLAGSNRQSDTLDSLDFLARLGTRLDTKIACRVLPAAYVLRHRLVLPVLAAFRRAPEA